MKTPNFIRFIGRIFLPAIAVLSLCACGDGDNNNEDVTEDVGNNNNDDVTVQVLAQAVVSDDDGLNILRANLAFFLTKEEAQEALNTGCGEAYHTVTIDMGRANPGDVSWGGAKTVTLPGDRYYYVIAFGDFDLRNPDFTPIRSPNSCLDEGEVYLNRVLRWFWNDELAVDVEDARKAKLESVHQSGQRCFDLDGGTCNTSNPSEDVIEPPDTHEGTDTNEPADNGGPTVNGTTTFEIDGTQYSAESTTTSGAACWQDGALFGEPGHASAQILEVVSGFETKGVVIDVSLDVGNTSPDLPAVFENSRNSFSITVHANGTEYSSLNVPMSAEFDCQVIINQWDGTTGAGTFSGNLYETSGSDPVYVSGSFSADM